MEYKKFLQNLKQLREEKGISMKKMGEFLGVSYIQYGNIEAGRSGFKVPDLFSVCKALKVHPNTYLKGIWKG
ncbi:MAG: helix-turn-helix transcriptional regulator [Clostridia bacterium]|nr:helix-turn-helix transcriptional regulator [Clostridia bacterium]